MSGTFSEWSPYEQYVQSGLVDGAYAHGGFTMLAAGPPRLSDVGGAISLSTAVTQGGAAANQIVMPVGIIQNFNLTQTRAFSRIFELGSERSYFISGRTVGQVGLGRVYYHGASLLRILYAYFMDLLPGGGVLINPMYPNQALQNMANPHDVIIPPGYENIYLNLASDLFSQPVGMMLYIRDSNLRTLGSLYFESSFIPNHSWAVDSQGVMIQESVGVQYERIVPVAVTDVALITNDAPYTGGSNQVGGFTATTG
jgi:hypothetical protein